MADDEQARRTVQFPPAPSPGGGHPIVAIFGLPASVSTEGPTAQAVTARAFSLSQRTGDPIEIDLDELEAAAAVDAALARVPVVVPYLWIEDGSTLPAVGDVVEYPLTFIEGDDPDDELAATWPVEIEPLHGGEPQRTGPPGGPLSPPYWLVLVRGPGWSAIWSAPRPMAGAAQLRGRLLADLGGGVRTDTCVFGRIDRLWVISQTIDQSGGNHHDLSQIVPGSRRLHEVQISPRWFDKDGHGRPDQRPAPQPPAPGTRFVFTDGPPPPDPWVCETGVLAELDLVPNRQG